MKIKVVGSGCPSCSALHEKVKKIVSENKIDAKIEYVKDINELVNLGVMSSPALVIDGKVAMSGAVSDSDLKKTILEKTKKI
ncbi:MAG: thioredoxin family protein [Candidatus Micrarchaeota archaeon]